MNENNPKNYLHELVKEWGHPDSFVAYRDWSESDGKHYCEIQLLFSDDLHLSTSASANRKKEAQMEAAASMLVLIRTKHSNLLINWEEIFVQAQAGDALVKLAAYMSETLDTPEKKSNWLQKNETDSFFIEMFDQLYEQKDARVSMFGENLGKKRKATYIEALIWQTYGEQFLDTPQKDILTEIFHFGLFNHVKKEPEQ